MRYILKWLLFSLAFVPLFVSNSTLSPFVFTKTLVIRILITFFWILFTIFFFTKRAEAKAKLENIFRFFKNPVYIFVSIFTIFLILSTVFAVNKSIAFFGDIERGEGLLGMLYFLSFFAATLLVFNKRDWITFFRLSIITGLILFIDSIVEVFGGELARAESFIGSPTFLAAYFLFVIFAALISFHFSDNKSFWRIFSFLMIGAGTIGIFLTGTRGAMLGLFVGAFFAALYLTVKGGNISPGGSQVRLQKFGVVFLLLIVTLVGSVIATRDSLFWQNVPGLDRFATVSLDDPTFRTRFISIGVSLDAVNPKDNGARRFLVGYGPDNFNIAYNKYYNPDYLRYENRWFDRAHNKVLDVLVMNGLFGLLAYLGIWLSLFYLALWKIPERKYAAAVIFFGSAYFVQNLFAFDQVSTYIPLFALLAFAVFLSDADVGEPKSKLLSSTLEKVIGRILPYKLIFISAFFAFALFAYTLIPYLQTVRFVKAIQSGDPQVLLREADDFSKPYTYAQPEIRNNFISLVTPFVGDPEFEELVNKAIALQEDYFSREPYDPRDSSHLANVHRLKSDFGEVGAYEKAVQYELISLELSPRRQDHLFSIGSLAADIGDFDEANRYARQMLEASPDVAHTKILYAFLIAREGKERYTEALDVMNSAMNNSYIYSSGESETNAIRSAYSLYGDYFYEMRDEDKFFSALLGIRDFELRLEEINREKFESGSLSELPQTRSDDIEKDISLFTEGGWNALGL